MTMTTPTRQSREQRVLKLCLGVFAVLVLLKFTVILVEADWDLVQSPYGLLVVILIPVLLLAWLVERRPRAASIAIAAAMLLFILIVASALLRDGFARQGWQDYPFAYGGLAVALVAIYSSIRLLNSSRS